jgi:citronellol/citronellal dehydrogenase
MSLITLGLSGELEGSVGANGKQLHRSFKMADICLTALWPLTTIETAALQILGDNHKSRDVSIMAEVAYEMLKKDGRLYT